MNILAFDVSTHACTVALRVGDRYFSHHIIAPQGHASLLLLLIQKLLQEAEVELSAVQAIAFGAGPGSFMGVRLALSMAQGLAFGVGIPVIPVSSLQILAQTAIEKNAIHSQQFLVGWDARMNEIYWGVYQKDDHGIARPLVEDTLSAPEAVSALPISDCAVGNAWAVYRERLLAIPRETITDIYPTATALLTIASDQYAKGETVVPELAEPQYIRNQVIT